jgi:hypothetical protein
VVTDSSDLFLEGLINNVRNSVISHQNFVFKNTKKSRRDLESKLKVLHSDPASNLEEIIELENSLNRLVDSELRHELSKYSGFEVLNSEKITPFFLSLAKGSQIEAKMEDIRDERGNNFDSSDARKNFIRQFYANIYRKCPDEPEDLEGCIEQFLGPDICANQLLQTAGSQLT